MVKTLIKKVWYKRMWVYIVGSILFAFAIYLVIQGIRCNIAVKNGEVRLATYHAATTKLSYGNMTYVDSIPDGGVVDDKVILSMHGMFGGYDQGFDTCKDFRNDYRILAPSRFGYLGSDVMGGGTPSEQAAAYVELLDRLGIEKVYPLATSAGGTSAIRFALDYPERTAGLILYCSSMPLPKKPDKYPHYIGPPAFLCNNYAMFLFSPLFEPVMGMEQSTIYNMMPMNKRSTGAKIDASVSNTDMLKNFDAYPVEQLQVKTLILHAKDDKMAKYSDTENAVPRFPNSTFISFETGGHLMAGHGEEIKKAVADFILD